MLTINFKKPYRKRDNSVGFIYTVTGEEKESAEYITTKAAQGLTVKNKDGEVVFFSNEYQGKSVPLLKSEKGNYYPENTEHLIHISMQRQIQGNKAVASAE